MLLFTSFNINKETSKYLKKQKALQKSFISRVRGYIKAQKFAADDAQIAIVLFEKERDDALVKLEEAESLVKKLDDEG